MPRLLFEKKGNGIWISHLDLMRMFQRAFKRAGLPLTHTHGFNPRPSVSIALPLSVGIESSCELLDFQLDGEQISCEEICTRLNKTLVSGIRVLKVYEDGVKLKHLSFLRCRIELEFDAGVPAGAAEQIRELFSRETVVVPKKTKSNGIQDQDIIPMIRSMDVAVTDGNTVTMEAVICCQNPTLNPMQMVLALERELPELKFQFARCARLEIYDEEEKVFR